LPKKVVKVIIHLSPSGETSQRSVDDVGGENPMDRGQEGDLRESSPFFQLEEERADPKKRKELTPDRHVADSSTKSTCVESRSRRKKDRR